MAERQTVLRDSARRSVRGRIVRALAALLLLVGSFAFAWLVLPSVRSCPAIDCGPSFDPGGVDLFGFQVFTLAQTLVMVFGIWASGVLLARAFLPERTWTCLGFGFMVLAFVVALTLPSPATGPVPTEACSTPGASGPIEGRCATGEAPVDPRVPDRLLLIGAGLLAVWVGSSVDRHADRTIPDAPTR